MNWKRAQEWEGAWWGNCVNTYGEEFKQLLYAEKMGLEAFHNGKSPYNFDLGGVSVLDIGGGPASLLLKCVNFSRALVVDPLVVPGWVGERYKLAGIEFLQGRAEDLDEEGWDECWIYNVLQHVESLRRVVKRARRAASLIRIFEWLDTPMNEGHLHTLTEDLLNEWLGGEGKVEQFSGRNTCVGKAYYGIFPTA